MTEIHPEPEHPEGHSTQADTQHPESHRRQLAYWLIGCCVMIYMMVVIGGVTRLTHSGLSMVEWKPILGTIPPLNQQEWEVAFAKYKKFPEYKVRRGMQLAEFKKIFFVEYFHRLFGRLIGLVFFIPFVLFWLLKRIPKPYIKHFLGLFILGGLQGVLGWYMVKSGLVNVPRVSPYRLTAHLGLAFFLYGYTLWLALDLLGFTHQKYASEEAELMRSSTWNSLRTAAKVLLGIIFVMILSGGFVAGSRAGFAFNTWPLMNGSLIPSGLLNLKPWFINAFENNLTIQFNHRMIAYILSVAIPVFWWKSMKLQAKGKMSLVLNLFLGGLVLQVALGITTLLWVVPMPLAAAHQAGALLLMTFSLLVVHYLKQVPHVSSG